MESISVNREKAREKDREEVKKMISLRYGETKAKDQSGKNPTNEKPSQTSTDNKTETKDEKPNDKK